MKNTFRKQFACLAVVFSLFFMIENCFAESTKEIFVKYAEQHRKNNEIQEYIEQFINETYKTLFEMVKIPEQKFLEVEKNTEQLQGMMDKIFWENEDVKKYFNKQLNILHEYAQEKGTKVFLAEFMLLGALYYKNDEDYLNLNHSKYLTVFMSYYRLYPEELLFTDIFDTLDSFDDLPEILIRGREYHHIDAMVSGQKEFDFKRFEDFIRKEKDLQDSNIHPFFQRAYKKYPTQILNVMTRVYLDEKKGKEILELAKELPDEKVLKQFALSDQWWLQYIAVIEIRKTKNYEKYKELIEICRKSSDPKVVEYAEDFIPGMYRRKQRLEAQKNLWDAFWRDSDNGEKVYGVIQATDAEGKIKISSFKTSPDLKNLLMLFLKSAKKPSQSFNDVDSGEIAHDSPEFFPEKVESEYGMVLVFCRYNRRFYIRLWLPKDNNAPVGMELRIFDLINMRHPFVLEADSQALKKYIVENKLMGTDMKDGSIDDAADDLNKAIAKVLSHENTHFVKAYKKDSNVKK